MSNSGLTVKRSVYNMTFFVLTERQQKFCAKQGCRPLGKTLYAAEVPRDGRWVNLPFAVVFHSVESGCGFATRRFRFVKQIGANGGIIEFLPEN